MQCASSDSSLCSALTSVELHGSRTLKRQPHSRESISQTLHSNADGSVSEVTVLRLYNRIEVDIDDFVKILGHHFRDFVQSLEIVRAVRLVHECGEIERG